MSETKVRKSQRTAPSKTQTTRRSALPPTQNNLVVGVLAEFTDTKQPRVMFNGSPENGPIYARTLVALDTSDIGQPVALQFEFGDLRHPVIIGRLCASTDSGTFASPAPVAHLIQGILDIAKSDDEILFVAKRKITLKCGNASITLDAEGKIELRGEYILSRSAGQNRIKGSSISLN